ncbi:MAG: hypothetical protein ACOYU7_02280 [Bacillota bacterium]
MDTCVVVKARYTRDGRLISRSTHTGPSSTPEMADQAVKALLAIIDVQGLRRDGVAGCNGDTASMPKADQKSKTGIG